jgi:large subunit ribosomal protein L24
VAILDPKSNKASRVGAKVIIDEKTGKQKRARISKASGEMLQ